MNDSGESERSASAGCAEASAKTERIAQLEADALRQNKIMHLAAQDEVFFGGFIYDPDDREFRVPRPLILCSDFFASAADCEEFEPGDVDAIHDAYMKWGHKGILAWVSLKRGAGAWRIKDAAWLDEFERIKDELRRSMRPDGRD